MKVYIVSAKAYREIEDFAYPKEMAFNVMLNLHGDEYIDFTWNGQQIRFWKIPTSFPIAYAHPLKDDNFLVLKSEDWPEYDG